MKRLAFTLFTVAIYAVAGVVLAVLALVGTATGRAWWMRRNG